MSRSSAAARVHLAGEVDDDYRWWVLAVTSIGALLASLTSGTLVIALPDILRDLHTDLFALLWIVVGYTLVVTVLVLNAGRLADMFGRARDLHAGHRASSRSPRSRCALAAGRATRSSPAASLQGVGGAFIIANSAASSPTRSPAGSSGRALGINAMVVGAGLILGPILGGWLTSVRLADGLLVQRARSV